MSRNDSKTADANTRNGMSWQAFVLLGGMAIGVLILVAHALGLF